jgi:hypothetical protein
MRYAGSMTPAACIGTSSGGLRVRYCGTTSGPHLSEGFDTLPPRITGKAAIHGPLQGPI